MLAYYMLALLIVISLWLNHADKFISYFFKLYRKVVKPKFKVGEKVMVDEQEWEILYITEQNPPYIYFCCPIRLNNGTVFVDPYISEYKIKHKTGILKELD